MTHNSSGLTITFPPFDPNTDKLFQAIRAFIEMKHEEVERRLQRIETRQQKILTTMGTMEQLMTAAINAAAAAAATAATLNRVAGGLAPGVAHTAAAAAAAAASASPGRNNGCASSRVNVVEPVRVLPFDTVAAPSSSASAPASGAKARLSPGSSAAGAGVDAKSEPGVRFALASPDRPVAADFDFDPGAYGALRPCDPRPSRAHYSAVRGLFGSGPGSDSPVVSQTLSLAEDARKGGGPKGTEASPLGDVSSLPALQTSSIGTQMRVIFDREDKRYIWLGGHQAVRLPLWAYVKCLETTRGMPDELGPRISLRMLQALFGKHYMLTHNYSGTNGKAPIDRDVLNAVLDQALLQFGSDHFYKDATCLSKFRDYINNAFRVVAYRDRKGVSVTCPFWDASGQPMTDFFLLKSADLIRRLRLDQYDALGAGPGPGPGPEAEADDGPPLFKRARASGSAEGPGVDLYTAVSFPVTTIDSLSVREADASLESLPDSEPEPERKPDAAGGEEEK